MPLATEEPNAGIVDIGGCTGGMATFVTGAALKADEKSANSSTFALL